MSFINDDEGNLKLGNTIEIDVNKQTDINVAANEANSIIIADDNEDISPTNNTTLDQNRTSPVATQGFSTEPSFHDGKTCTIRRPKWNFKSALIGVTIMIVIGVSCYYIRQSLTRRKLNSQLRGFVLFEQFPDVNPLDNNKVSYAIYKQNNEAKYSWKVEVCESEYVLYNNSISKFEIDYHGILMGQLNMQHTKISCIKIHHRNITGKFEEFCQKMSEKLRIPVSLFFISAVSGKQTIHIPRDKFKPSDTDNDANYLSLITWPEGPGYAQEKFKLNIKETFSSGYLNGRLSWQLSGNHGIFPWTYNHTSSSFIIHRDGIYLVLLTLHSNIYTSNIKTVKMQACLNNTCARLELFEGMAAPLTLIDINRLPTSHEFDVKFYNIPGLYRFSLINTFTIFSFPIHTPFQKYLLNERLYSRTSEYKHRSLQWKSTRNAEFKIIILLDNNTFKVQEKGNYLIILSLNLYTRNMRKDVLQCDEKCSHASLVACIRFSNEISRCQNYTLPLGVVLPVMLTHVKHLSSEESFHITLNQAALYRSENHNSVIVVKL